MHEIQKSLDPQQKRMALMLVTMLDGKEHYLSEIVDIVLKKKIVFLSEHDIRPFYKTFGTDDDAISLMKAFSRIKKNTAVFTKDRKVDNGPTPDLRYFALDPLKLHEIYKILLKINRALREYFSGSAMSQNDFLSLFVESPFFKSVMKDIVSVYGKLNEHFKSYLKQEIRDIPESETFKADLKSTYEDWMLMLTENPPYFERVIKIVLISPSALSRFLEVYLRYQLEYLDLNDKRNKGKRFEKVEGDIFLADFGRIRMFDFHDFYDQAKIFLLADYYDQNLIGDVVTKIHGFIDHDNIHVALRIGVLDFPEIIGEPSKREKPIHHSKMGHLFDFDE